MNEIFKRGTISQLSIICLSVYKNVMKTNFDVLSVILIFGVEVFETSGINAGYIIYYGHSKHKGCFEKIDIRQTISIGFYGV